MDHLLQAAVRSLPLAAVAALGLWRVKSASVKHAVWTLVMVSMLIQIALAPLLPEIPLRVLGAAEPVAISVISQDVPGAALSSVTKPHAVVSWAEVAAAVYFCGLLFFIGRLIFALLFARRLVRASELACSGAYQSVRISAPVTIGRTILLPMSWSEWDCAKLHAVLAHEEAHVRRHDWTIAAMARLNQCLFWFHPLAWWLERQLARLAEQACDDEALAVIQDRRQYAQALLDIARTIHFSKGRLLVVSMAKEVNVETRIDRILDETRQIPKALGGRGWMALAVLAAPLIYFTAAIQIAPAQTTVMTVPPPAPPAPPQIPGSLSIAQAPAPPAAPPPPAQTPTQPPARPRSQAPLVAGPIYIPKVYNGRNKTFWFFNYEQSLEKQNQDAQAPLEQTPAPPPPQAQTSPEFFVPTGVGAPVYIDVKTLRTTVISIPLDATQQYDVVGVIKTAGGTLVMDFRDVADYRQTFEKNVQLKDGKYVLRILLRTRDGRMSTKETSFEVE